MSKILRLFFLVLLTACASKNQKTPAEVLDSIQKAKQLDSKIKDRLKELALDTVGMANSPIQIVQSEIKENYLTQNKDIILLIKNVSGKKVLACRVKWYAENAFGEPVDMGNGNEGLGAGQTETALDPGEQKQLSWPLENPAARHVIAAWAYEVVFSDGRKWIKGK